MSGNHNKRGELFSAIHHAMRHQLQELAVKFSCWGEYYEAMYAWFPEFREDLDNLRAREPLAAEDYLSSLSYGGLLKLDLNEMGEWNKGIGLPLKKKGGRFSPLYLANSDRNISLAGEYLKQHFSMRFYHFLSKSDPNLSVCDASERGCSAVVEAGLCVVQKSRPDLAKYIYTFAHDHKLDCFQLWATVIIYAQSRTLPQVHQTVQPGHLGEPNIFIASKGEIQKLSPLENRCGGATRILIVNYAGTAMLAAERITAQVKNSWSVFLHNLLSGGTKVDIVLTDPETSAARDAEQYKMRPYTLKIPLDRIIPENIRDLEHTMEKYTDSDIHLYLTDIALPCAYLKAEFSDDPSRDNIKIDLYLPTFAQYLPNAVPEDECDDNLRQSFVIFRKSNPDLYDVFSRNMERILEHSTEYQGGNKNDY